MSRIELFPDRFLDATMLREMLDWLRDLPAPDVVRKEMLCDWCRYVGVDLEAWMVDQIGIVRG